MSTHLMMDKTAQDIAARSLDVTGDALLTGDFASFAPEFALPHHISTPQGALQVASPGDMRDRFEKMVAYYQKIQVVDLQRTLESAFFDCSETLRYSYTTVMRFADDTTDSPYYCHASMRQQQGKWQLIETQYALGPRVEQSNAMVQTDRSARNADAAAQNILQLLLDDMTRSFLAADFDRFASRAAFPFFLQGDEGSRIYKDRASLLQDLGRYKTGFVIQEVTDIIRTVKWAEMIGDKRLHGTYRTHVLSGASMVIDPYSSAITLELGKDDIWRCTSVLHPMGHLTGSGLRTEQQAKP